MTLKEEFDNIEIMFESQIGTLKYDELYEASNHCVRIADDYAVEFAEWIDRIRLYNTTLWQEEDYDKLLEIFKKEKGL
jgi:hypothetical protein